MKTLPTVGTDCEALQDDMRWVEVRCVAHYEGFAVCVKDEGGLSADIYEIELLRPVQEQDHGAPYEGEENDAV